MNFSYDIYCTIQAVFQNDDARLTVKLNKICAQYNISPPKTYTQIITATTLNLNNAPESFIENCTAYNAEISAHISDKTYCTQVLIAMANYCETGQEFTDSIPDCLFRDLPFTPIKTVREYPELHACRDIPALKNQLTKAINIMRKYQMLTLLEN